MKDIIVFSHMMKTAGSTLTKGFIEYYGSKVLDVSYNTRLNSNFYNQECLLNDLKKKNYNVKVIVGHSIRPSVDYNLPNFNLRWITFLRNPIDRYVSNYFYMYHLKNKFQLSHYDSMKAINIEEWEKVDHFSNYQTRFIAGEANAQTAIDILENKFDWVGITEEFDQGIQSFKSHFNWNDLYINQKKLNTNKATREEIEKIKANYADFINDRNTEDQILYNYVKKHIWPKYKTEITKQDFKQKSSHFTRAYNKCCYHFDNQLKFKKTKISLKNISRFYSRWYKS